MTGLGPAGSQQHPDFTKRKCSESSAGPLNKLFRQSIHNERLLIMPVRTTPILSSLWHLSIEFWNNLIYFSFNSHDSKLFSLKQISNVNFLCKILSIKISSRIDNVHAAKLLNSMYLWSRRWCSRRWSCWWAPAAAARCPSPRPAAWSGPTRTPGRPSCVILHRDTGQQHRSCATRVVNEISQSFAHPGRVK